MTKAFLNFKINILLWQFSSLLHKVNFGRIRDKCVNPFRTVSQRERYFTTWTEYSGVAKKLLLRYWLCIPQSNWQSIVVLKKYGMIEVQKSHVIIRPLFLHKSLSMSTKTTTKLILTIWNVCVLKGACMVLMHENADDTEFRHTGVCKVLINS